MKVCNDTCKWLAAINCEKRTKSSPAAKQSLSLKPVCFDIQLNIVGETQSDNSTLLKKNSTARWELGTCASLNSIENGTTYQYPARYTERCCLKSGRHILVCYNNPPSRGWKNAYININEHRYCDDFISYKSYQKILVTGVNLSNYFTFKDM